MIFGNEWGTRDSVKSEGERSNPLTLPRMCGEDGYPGPSSLTHSARSRVLAMLAKIRGGSHCAADGGLSAA